MQPDFIFIILILIFSIVIHEVSHGYAANSLGDPTARLAGRLTLNPLKHLDLMGSIIVPAILILTSAGFIFGWAKPVPYNPYNLRNQRWGEAIVGGAGPAVNILIAIIFGLLIRFGMEFGFVTASFIQIAGIVVFVNILLGLFNLIPFPPLDGSKVFASILPYRAAESYRRFMNLTMRHGLIVIFGFLFLFIFIFGPIFIRLISFISFLITGIHVF